MTGKWIRVNSREPCIICERPDWCVRTADGELCLCMRVKSPCALKTGGWIHQLSDPLPEVTPSPATQKKPDWTPECKAMFNHWDAPKARRYEAHRLGVTVESLEALRVGVGFDRDGQFTSWPMRDASGKCIGYTRRYLDGRKRTNKGGSMGLFYAYGWAQSNSVIVVEGGSDVAACLSHGFSAIGRPSNTGGLKLLQDLLKGYRKPVFVVGERDRKPDRCSKGCPGCAYCWPGLYGMQVTSNRLHVSGIMVPEGSKDAREALKERKSQFLSLLSPATGL